MEHFANFLIHFNGFRHCDGYYGYNLVDANTRHMGCGMSVRRDFYDVRSRDTRVLEALGLIRRLYAIERETNLSDLLPNHWQLPTDRRRKE
jgi:Transposase IS66 family